MDEINMRRLVMKLALKFKIPLTLLCSPLNLSHLSWHIKVHFTALSLLVCAFFAFLMSFYYFLYYFYF